MKLYTGYAVNFGKAMLATRSNRRLHLLAKLVQEARMMKNFRLRRQA